MTVAPLPLQHKYLCNAWGFLVALWQAVRSSPVNVRSFIVVGRSILKLLLKLHSSMTYWLVILSFRDLMISSLHSLLWRWLPRWLRWVSLDQNVTSVTLGTVSIFSLLLLGKFSFFCPVPFVNFSALENCLDNGGAVKIIEVQSHGFVESYCMQTDLAQLIHAEQWAFFHV